jgi:hypothetical protein
MTQDEIIQFLESKFQSQLKKAARSKPTDSDEIGRIYRFRGIVMLWGLDRVIPFYEAWSKEFLPEGSTLAWLDLQSRTREDLRYPSKAVMDALLVDITKPILSKFASLVTKTFIAKARDFINFDRSMKLPDSIYGLMKIALLVTVYYMRFAPRMPHSVNLKVDLICSTVIEELELKHAMISEQGRNIDRTRKAARLKQEIKSQRKQIVLDSYYRLACITRYTKPFTAAKMIHGDLQGRTQNPPSIKTIMRYLSEEKIARREGLDKHNV